MMYAQIRHETPLMRTRSESAVPRPSYSYPGYIPASYSAQSPYASSSPHEIPVFAQVPELPQKKYGSSKTKSSKQWAWIVVAAAATLLTGGAYYAGKRQERLLHEKLEAMQATKDELLLNQEELLLDMARQKQALEAHQDRQQQQQQEDSALIKHFELLKREMESKALALHHEQVRRQEAESAVEAVRASLQRDTLELRGQFAAMQQDMGKMFLSLIRQAFGKGPHYVEFQLRFSDSKTPKSDNDDDTGFEYFTAMLAPAHRMPATVFTFLRQVQEGLWDGTSFYINAPHIVLSKPSSSSSKIDRQPEMEELGIARVPYKEYDSNFPHVAYTLGLSSGSRPGPGFYINKANMVEHHTDEPCFGKILVGRQVAERMFSLEAVEQRPGQEQTYEMKKPVEIVSVRILKKLEDAVGASSAVKKRNSLAEDL